MYLDRKVGLIGQRWLASGETVEEGKSALSREWIHKALEDVSQAFS